MSFFDASKVPLIINLHIPTDRPDQREMAPLSLAAVYPLRGEVILIPILELSNTDISVV